MSLLPPPGRAYNK